MISIGRLYLGHDFFLRKSELRGKTAKLKTKKRPQLKSLDSEIRTANHDHNRTLE